MHHHCTLHSCLKARLFAFNKHLLSKKTKKKKEKKKKINFCNYLIKSEEPI